MTELEALRLGDEETRLRSMRARRADMAPGVIFLLDVIDARDAEIKRLRIDCAGMQQEMVHMDEAFTRIRAQAQQDLADR
jgi:hypothetical protein